MQIKNIDLLSYVTSQWAVVKLQMFKLDNEP